MKNNNKKQTNLIINHIYDAAMANFGVLKSKVNPKQVKDYSEYNSLSTDNIKPEREIIYYNDPGYIDSKKQVYDNIHLKYECEPKVANLDDQNIYFQFECEPEKMNINELGKEKNEMQNLDYKINELHKVNFITK